MKKSSSFSERLINENTEVPDFIPAAPPNTTGPESNLPRAEPEEPQYARVNKPPRTSAGTAHTSSSSLAGAQPEPHPGPYPAPHSGVAPPLRGAGETLGEGKYWELVPMHTYEETHHVPRPDESPDHIEFYAMARRQDVMRSEEGANNHLYSEVNLMGSRDVPSTTPLSPPTRTAPGLPLRPPPRLTDCPAHPDSALQRMDGWPPQPGPAPSLPGSCSPIYEQIPEGGLSARPPLRPQNHNH
ncbi:hypothetical protein GJAV_G00102460 [Gymnothorax javanicus]|nr:hypothetical protein GJAV_G00102460 [Gymnothorax javanicus]